MIFLSQPAVMQCDAAGCSAQQPARMVLLLNGGFGARMETPGWGASKHPQSGAIMVTCPVHQVVVAPPALADAAADAMGVVAQ